MARDYYAELGVARDATPEDIKSAFRRLARESHPDANPGDPGAEARFRQIAEAYEVLSNPDRRRSHDRGETLDFGDVFAGFGGLDDLIRSVFGDGGFFGSPGGRQASHRGRDILVQVEVELASAAFGGETEVSFRTRLACDSCGGEGSAPGTFPVTCPSCGGAGTVRVARRGLLGTMMTLSPCTTCSGHGTIISEPCASCRGAGAVTGDRTVRVEIPAGVTDGTRLRLTARGEHPGRRGVAGDLHVEIRSKPNEDFTREGDHLVYRHKVGMAEAALGVKVEVPLLEGGTEPFEIPPGTQPSTVFRLPGLGTAHLGRRGRGDLLVVAEVEVPTSLSREEEDALRNFAQLRGERPATGKRRRNR